MVEDAIYGNEVKGEGHGGEEGGSKRRPIRRATSSWNDSDDDSR